MNHWMRSLFDKAVPAIVALAGIVALDRTPVHSQTWEGLYGGLGIDQGHGSVIPIANTPGGGYVIAGGSNSPSLSPVDQDVYITKVNNVGATLWTVTYDLSAGQNDVVNDIKELANGSFIVTGVTATRPTLYNDPNYGDLFIMKLDANGQELWTQTYGGSFLDYGSSIAVDPDNGDIIVAGTTLSFGATPSGVPFTVPSPLPPPSTPLDPVPNDGDAFILRTDPNGTILWMRTFGGEHADGFNSVIVSLNDPFQQKDIIAAGYSENFVLQGGAYVKQLRPFIVRVSSDGLIGLSALTNSMVANGATIPPATINCIRQIPGGNDFIAVGNTSLNGDVYIMRVNSNLTAMQDWRIGQTNFLEQGKWLDFRQDVKYDPNPADKYAAEYVPVIVANRMNPATGLMDVWAFELYVPPFPRPMPPPPPAAAVLWSNIYGGAGTEEAVSIAYVHVPQPPPAAPLPPVGRTGGFIISGMWANNVPPNPLGIQSYLLKTNLVGVTNCETPVAHTPVSLGDASLIVDPYTYRVRVQCEAIAAETFASHDQTLICPLCLLCKTVADPAEELAAASPTAGAESAIDAASLKVYPNPIGKEERFNVEYRLLMGTESTITVTDLAGKEVYRAIDHNVAGDVAKEISVGNWAAGTYLVKVTAADGNFVVKQVVVGGK